MKKKPFSRKTAALLVMALMCQQVPVQAAKIAKVKLSVSDCILSKEDSRNLNVQGMDERSGSYRSQNKKIAVVSKKGIVRAKKAGETQIIWTKGKKKLVCSVVVVKEPAVSRQKVTVKAGSSEKVSVKLFGNAGLKVSWKSADPEIAMVKGGNITGVSEGTTVVTAKVKGYTKTYLKQVTVIVETADEETTADSVSPMAPVMPWDSIPEDSTGNDPNVDMENPGVIEKPSGTDIDNTIPTVPVLTGPSILPSLPVEDDLNTIPGMDSVPGNTTIEDSSQTAGNPADGTNVPSPAPAPDAGSQENNQTGGSTSDAGNAGNSQNTGSAGNNENKENAGGTENTGNHGNADGNTNAGNTGSNENTDNSGNTDSNTGAGDAGNNENTGGNINAGDTENSENTGNKENAGESENTNGNGSAGGNTSAGNEENSGSTGESSTDDKTPEENQKPGESDSSQTVPSKSMAEQVAEIVNEERAKQGLSALTLDTKLTACAELRAEELIEEFSHKRPDGTSCFSVLDENNIMYFTCGENIAYGYRTAQSVMNGWMNSDGHRANILNANFGKIGIGYVKSGGTAYWVQLFTD